MQKGDRLLRQIHPFRNEVRSEFNLTSKPPPKHDWRTTVPGALREVWYRTIVVYGNSFDQWGCKSGYLDSIPIIPFQLRAVVCADGNSDFLPRKPSWVNSLCCIEYER